MAHVQRGAGTDPAAAARTSNAPGGGQRTPAKGCSPHGSPQSWGEQAQRWNKRHLGCVEGGQGTANYSALMRPFHGQKYSGEADGGIGRLASFWVRGERHRLDGNTGSTHGDDLGGGRESGNGASDGPGGAGAQS